jgi:selenocysteine lyase/cysteine desulfurase
MSLDLHAHFSIFRDAAPDRIHLAAHSHHYWPDSACRAHERAMHEAARLADKKWDMVLDDLVPLAQRGVARILNLPDPATLAFAPNTHELVCRLLSALPLQRAPRVLTSDAEFHSFARQIARLEEERLIEVERIAAEPVESFPNRFCKAARVGGHDLVFVSHVFFKSGATCGDIGAIVKSVPSPQTLIAIDGYHGFCALPTDLSAVAERVFYLARAIQAGSRASARRATGKVASAMARTVRASWGRPSIRAGYSASPRCWPGWTASACRWRRSMSTFLHCNTNFLPRLNRSRR